MKKRISLIVVVIFTLSLYAMAQRQKTKTTLNVDTMATVNTYLDSLLTFRKQQMSADKAEYANADVALKPDGRFYRLFAPLTFYHSPAYRSLALSNDGDSSATAGKDDVAEAVDDVLMVVYLNRPDLVSGTESILKKTGSVRDDLDRPVKNDVAMSKAVEPVPDTPDIIPQGLVIQKPNFWTFKGDGNMQLMQNFVSDNWYKGGESNYSMVGQVTLSANYNNKSGLQLENILELKLGFQTSPSDTVHKFKTNNDLIRYTGRLGLQASKKWYYTLQLLAYTQFTRGYKSNDKKVYSDFMSPFNLNLGLGMTYNLSAFNGKLTGKVNLSPFSYNWKYIDRTELCSYYGIGDHHSMDDFGSQITSEIEWKLSDVLKWKSRFYFYTTYSRAEMEWENTFQMNISRYITTNVFLYPRFDDSVGRDRDLGYWQFREYCSLGLAYAF